MISKKIVSIRLAIFFLATSAFAQAPPAPESHQANAKCDDHVRSTYLLGPDDSLDISGPELTEVGTKPVRINSDGNIQVPPAGTVHVAGLTAQQTELELNKALSKYIRQPQAVVTISELRSQPVSVLGAVNTPGVHQVQGHKTLLEMISQAGGIR